MRKTRVLRPTLRVKRNQPIYDGPSTSGGETTVPISPPDQEEERRR